MAAAVVPGVQPHARRPARRRGRAATADLASRRVTSSARTSSRKSAWVIFCCRARVSRSGRVSSIWPSLSARSVVRRSGLITSRVMGGHRVPPSRRGERQLPGRYSAGSRANRAVRGHGRVRRQRRALGGFLQHRGDLGDVDDVEVQGPLAGGVDRAGPVAADQAEQPVDLPHLRPRQVGVQQPVGIDADGVAVPARPRRPATRRPASRRWSSPRAGRQGR